MRRKTRRLETRIFFRVSLAERDALRERARNEGTAMSEIIRKSLGWTPAAVVPIVPQKEQPGAGAGTDGDGVKKENLPTNTREETQ